MFLSLILAQNPSGTTHELERKHAAPRKEVTHV